MADKKRLAKLSPNADASSQSTVVEPDDNASTPPHWLLLFTVFVTGASVLIIELVGTRVISPFFGSGIYTWSALIAITLAALSLGYVIGGRYADKSPHATPLYLLCMLAGVWTVVSPWMAASLSTALIQSLDIRLSILLAATLLFFPNLFLLGGAGPFVIRLMGASRRNSGSTSGLVFAISTLGSLLGALVTGFMLVPNYGVQAIFVYCGFALLLLALLGFLYQRQPRPSLAVVVSMLICGFALQQSEPAESSTIEVLDRSPSFYGQLQVIQKGDIKLLLADGIGQNYVTSDENFAVSYINLFSALPRMRNETVPAQARALVIGMGAGQLPMLFEKQGVETDTVEIDPRVDELARKHFGFTLAPERVYFMDGRLFLSQSAKQYDYLVIDAFSSDQIASHLLSREALSLARQRLTSEGLVLNYTAFADGEDVAIVQRTMQEVFPYVRTFAHSPESLGSVVFMGANAPIDFQGGSIRLTRSQFTDIQKFFRGELSDLGGELVVTDDYNPLDHQRQGVQLAWRQMMWEFLGKEQLQWLFF